MRLITQYPERAEWWIEQERFRRSVTRNVRKPEREASEAVSCFCGD